MSESLGFNRRNLLRGMLGGTAITVGLPFLDCFLNTNGTALADGSELPVIFGTWFQSLGYTPTFWEPKTVGANYENNLQLKPMDPMKHKVTVFSGLRAYTDGNPLIPHESGVRVTLSGGVPKWNEAFPTLDTIIADLIGTRTRFRSLEVSCDGNPLSNSQRSYSSTNPSETSPAALYTRIFGPDFKDPNAAEFTPDPALMARRSVLSAVTERRTALAKRLGAADKVRLDEYFTSLRELENQLDLQLQKPAPLEACSVPAKGDADGPVSTDVDSARANHRLFAKLLANALACGQTKVINMTLGSGASSFHRTGDSMTFHSYTHEEAADPVLGYQKNVAWFQDQTIKSFTEFLQIFDAFKEGPKSLLDRSLIMYSTDVGFAKVHALENLPIMLAGGAGGRVKPGMHVPGSGNTSARVGLTAMQIMGVPISTWGTEANKNSKPFTEIMV